MAKSKSPITWLCPDKVECDNSNYSIKSRSSDAGGDFLCRTPFLIDYGSIVHASKFRRLSYKTQVYMNPQSDFVRTRMSHSMEVAQIGRQLARILNKVLNHSSKSSYYRETERSFDQDLEDLVASACLAHDLGQAPFGHKGEDVLAELARQHQSVYEGNRQNIRLLVGSDLRPSFGVSCALIDAISKYKDTEMFSENMEKAGGCYDSERDIFFKILNKTGTGKSTRHPACFLMEAADDICNIASDIEDAIKTKNLDRSEFLNLVSDFQILNRRYTIKRGLTWKKLFNEYRINPEYLSTHLIRIMVKLFARKIVENFDDVKIEDLPKKMNQFVKDDHHPKEKMNLLFSKKGLGNKLQELKTGYRNSIFDKPNIAQTEILAEKVVKSIWHEMTFLVTDPVSKFADNDAFKLLPEDVKEKILSLKDKEQGLSSERRIRILCDYISGMTDRFAIDYWAKLNEPERLRAAA